jgi:hypothetical protein
MKHGLGNAIQMRKFSSTLAVAKRLERVKTSAEEAAEAAAAAAAAAAATAAEDEDDEAVATGIEIAG